MDWAVARVQTGSELSLAARLVEAGIQVYLPVSHIKKTRRLGSNMPIEFDRAAWPGYVFIKLDTIGPELRRDRHFYYFLPGNGYIEPISNVAIEGIRLLERLGAFQTRDVESRAVREGEVVKVPTGPFMGRLGHVAQIVRERVLLDGRDFPKPVWVKMLNLVEEPL